MDIYDNKRFYEVIIELPCFELILVLKDFKSIYKHFLIYELIISIVSYSGRGIFSLFLRLGEKFAKIPPVRPAVIGLQPSQQ